MYSDNDYVDDNDSRQRFAKKRKSRTKDFTEADKKKLAALIRKEELLWDCTHVLHSNSSSVDKSWTEIGLKMGKTKEKCKLAWTALRESYRYHERCAKAYGDPLAYNQNMWPFSKELAFLANAKRVPKSLYPFIETSNDDVDVTDQDDLTTQSYIVKTEIRESSEVDDYDNDQNDQGSVVNMISESPNSMQNDQNETNDYDGNNETENSVNSNAEMSGLIKQLGKLVNAQTEFMRHFRGTGTENLAFQTQLVACDALLQQLPKNIAETTLVEIQNYILKKINDQQKQKT